jgi:mono/diheme cytochrome c family protein
MPTSAANHRRTRRNIACFAAALLLLTSGSDTISQTSPQSLFEQKCASCHSEARVLRSLRAIDAAERISRLERLLPGHYAADAGERKLIIDYLVAKAAK